MVYVKRDQDNNIIGIFDKDTEEGLESLPVNHKEVEAFLARCHLDKKSAFLMADLELIRVVEDLIQILIAKNVVSITDFPIPAIKKLVERNKIREQFTDISKIMDQS